MTLYSTLMIASWITFIFTALVGYFFCHFVFTPLLLKKHRNRGFWEAALWEGIQAENHLKDLVNETDDFAVRRTLNTIKYSKFIIAISVSSTVLFAVLEGLQ